MKGFKNTTRMQRGFNFTVTSTPTPVQRFAEGGKVVRHPDRPKVHGSSVDPKGGAIDNLKEALRPRKGETVRDQMIDKMSKKGGGAVKKARGGRIGGSLHGPTDDSQLDVEHGPRRGLRPGFTRGGYASKYAKGGKAHSDAAQDRPMMKKTAEKAVAKHVATPAPKGHKGLKSCK